MTNVLFHDQQGLLPPQGGREDQRVLTGPYRAALDGQRPNGRRGLASPAQDESRQSRSRLGDTERSRAGERAQNGTEGIGRRKAWWKPSKAAASVRRQNGNRIFRSGENIAAKYGLAEEDAAQEVKNYRLAVVPR